MSSFTCLNCGVRFATAEMQREHYKTHWHRYNLKRKLAELPPVSVEEFEKRVIQQKSDDAAAQQDQSLYCKACRKVFKGTIMENESGSFWASRLVDAKFCITEYERETSQLVAVEDPKALVRTVKVDEFVVI